MEEIHQAGQVHFANASHEENDLITAKFNSMVLYNDRRISKSAFLEQMKGDMPTNEASCLFTKLDQDRSGSLNFDEFKTYDYASNSRPTCDCCKKLVTGMYYCCVRCWKMHMTDGHELHRRFQVCAQCYSNKLFQHSHKEFLDNYMLLFRSKEILAVKTEKKVKVNPEAMEVKAALKAGRLFYRSLPDKNDAYNLFAVMDRNGDGAVSETEVIDFLTYKGMPRADACKLFKGTNLGRDGCLSIEDIGALWYISAMRPYCARCKARIMGTCYSCFECHNVSMVGYDNNTYDLCPECYSNGEYCHEHNFFLDNFALLQIKTLLSFPKGGQGPDMSYNQGLPKTTTRFHGGGQGPAMSFNQGSQGIHGGWQGPAMSYNQGLPGMTGGGQGPAMSFNQGLQGIHGGWQGPAMSYNNQGLPGMTTSFHGGWQGPAMSYNQGLPGTTTSFHGGGQGPAMSFNQGLPGTTTSFHGGGQGEGTRNFSKLKILEMLAHLSAVGTAVGTAGAFIATSATVGCSIV